MFLISHSSALEALRSIPPQVNRFKRFNDSIPVTELSAGSRKILPAGLDALGVEKRPVHVLVGTGAPKGKSSQIRTHWINLEELPPGLALELAPDVLVAGPELVFALLGRSLAPVAEVVLGYELCGCYSQFAKLVSGFYDRPPLTSVAAIGRALDELAGVPRLGRARSALRWVADGARSPMETVVACELSLPAELGGLGFQKPQLNYPVALDEAAARIAGCQTCYVDVAWPGARRGLEYNGSAYHLDAARDQRRREALAHMGWQLNVVDLDHMRDHGLLMASVALFEGDLPRQPGGAASAQAVAGLHQRLLKATRYGMGLEPALFGVPVPHGTVQLHL